MEVYLILKVCTALAQIAAICTGLRAMTACRGSMQRPIAASLIVLIVSLFAAIIIILLPAPPRLQGGLAQWIMIATAGTFAWFHVVIRNGAANLEN